MASGEEDGTVEEKETNNKKRTKGAIVTAWLTFYNIAMTAGYLLVKFEFELLLFIVLAEYSRVSFIVSVHCKSLNLLLGCFTRNIGLI